MGKYLSGAAGPAAQYGTAEMLRLMPYEKGTSEHYEGSSFEMATVGKSVARPRS